MKKPELGNHIARPVVATLCTSGKQNRPCVFIELVLVDDPNAGDGWTGWLGDKIGKDGKSLTERTVEVLRTCGWTGDDLSEISLPADAQVEITVADEDWEKDDGSVQTQRKIQFINPIGGGMFRPKKMDAREAKNFAEKLKTKVGGSGAKPKQKAPSPSDAGFGPPGGGDDDIPFEA